MPERPSSGPKRRSPHGSDSCTKQRDRPVDQYGCAARRVKAAFPPSHLPKHEKPRAGTGPGVAFACDAEARRVLRWPPAHYHSTATLLKRRGQVRPGDGRDRTRQDLCVARTSGNLPSSSPDDLWWGWRARLWQGRILNGRGSNGRAQAASVDPGAPPPADPRRGASYLVHHLAEEGRGVGVILLVGPGALVAVLPFTKVVGL